MSANRTATREQQKIVEQALNYCRGHHDICPSELEMKQGGVAPSLRATTLYVSRIRYSLMAAEKANATLQEKIDKLNRESAEQIANLEKKYAAALAQIADLRHTSACITDAPSIAPSSDAICGAGFMVTVGGQSFAAVCAEGGTPSLGGKCQRHRAPLIPDKKEAAFAPAPAPMSTPTSASTSVLALAPVAQKSADSPSYADVVRGAK